MTSQIETGTPYILFKDAANKKSNQQNLGTIRNSNLCVIGNTELLTKEGYKEIHSLENQEIEIWNGVQFSKSFVKKTGLNQKIIKLQFSNGRNIECTEYHKFFIKDDENNKIIKEAKNLNIDDEITPFELPQKHFMDSNIKWTERINNIINRFGVFKRDSFYLELNENNLLKIKCFYKKFCAIFYKRLALKLLLWHY